MAATCALAADGSAGRRRPARDLGTSPASEHKSSSAPDSRERPPDRRNTGEVGADGKKRPSGAKSDFTLGISGNATDKAIEVRASGENTAADEATEYVADLQPRTKWPEFDPESWPEFDPDAPVKVAAYARTPTNDFVSRAPGDGHGRGSADGQGPECPETREGESSTARFQPKTDDIGDPSPVMAYAHHRLEITGTTAPISPD
ncbi:hypothetical protein ACFYT4_09175 [Streptomyces sp. NPDC004609]|uniref:hypothetical protein n=1 Tax=Streptomyces sp. NPDC004609 TaxID=3364704 RepID=UPI0036898801